MSNFPTRRVAICAPGFPSSRDDSDKPFLLDHAKALVSTGLKVTVICPAVPGLPRRQVVEDILVLRVRYAPRRFETLASTGAMYREARGLRALLAIPMIAGMIIKTIKVSSEEGTVVCHGHWWMPGGFVAVIAARILKISSVVHLHGSDSTIVDNRFMRTLAHWVMSRATHCLAVSDRLAKWGQEVSERKVDVCGMPLRIPISTELSEAPIDGPILGVGRLVHEKGFDVLIEAMSSLDPINRPLLVIVGEGPEREALQKQASVMSVNLKLAGSVSPALMKDWYAKAQFVVVPSRREGFGLVAAEAAAHRRAVVASDVGAIDAIVKHGESGLLVEVENVEQLATALKNLDPSWGIKGPEKVAHMNLSTHGKWLLDLYAEPRGAT